MQLNLDYPDLLGLDEIQCSPNNRGSRYSKIWILMKNETYYFKKATFHCETTLLQIIWKTIWSTSSLFVVNTFTREYYTVLLLLSNLKAKQTRFWLHFSKLYGYRSWSWLTNIHDKIGTGKKVWIIKKSG